MKKSLFAFLILFSEIVFGETLEGVWLIEVKPLESEKFPFWREIKYPKKLEIKRIDENFFIKFTDQFDFECEGKAYPINSSKEIVFEFCGGWGTKSELAWGPIHHAKLVNGELNGVVSSHTHLFNWVGKRE